jgi:hypothetical protein
LFMCLPPLPAGVLGEYFVWQTTGLGGKTAADNPPSPGE